MFLILDFREADIANNRRTVEDEGEYISEENMPDMNTLHNDTRGVDGLENHHMEGNIMTAHFKCGL